MDVHATAAIAHVGTEGMLSLFFHHDWNVGTNLPGDRFC